MRLDRAPEGRGSGKFSRTLLLDWLEFWGEELDADDRVALTQDQHDELARRLRLQALAEGRLLSVPYSRTYTRCFGSWPETKVAGGWMDNTTAALQPSRENYSTDELVEAAVEALLELGPEMTVNDYRPWRLKRLTELSVTNPRARIPSDTLLRQRLGGPQGDWDVIRCHWLVLAPYYKRQPRKPS